MSTELLLQKFGRVADAPDAIKYLRQFVLDLAVRGMLTMRDPYDEPANSLLVRIEKEWTRAEGSRRRVTAFEPIGASEAPFSIPQEWIWTRVRQITKDRGQTLPATDFTYIDVTSIDKEIGRLGEPVVLSASDAPSRARKVVHRGDVLYSCVRPYLLNIAVVETEIDPPPIASTAFAVLNGFGLIEPRFLWTALRSPYFVKCVEDKMRGQAYPAINDSDFSQLPVPLPSRDEQRRIVEKVDELMSLCDRLEIAQQERELRRSALRTETLHRVISPGLSNSSVQDVRFFLDTSPRLITVREHVDDIRRAIRDLAVQGRLVQRLLPDETPANTLDSQHEDKASSLSEGDGTRPPNDWTTSTIGEIADMVTSGSRGWAEYYSAQGPSFIRAQNIRFGRLRLEDLAHVTLPPKNEGRRTQAGMGDILIVITGAGVTNPALVNVELGEAYVSQHVGLVKLKNKAYAPWVLLCLMAPHGCRDELVTRAYGAGKPGLNLDNIRTLLVPRPPLEEQKGILKCLESLMTVCDELETALTTAQFERGQLLDSLLHGALSESEAPRAFAEASSV